MHSNCFTVRHVLIANFIFLATAVPCIMTKRVNDLITLYGLIMEKHQQHKSDAKVVPLPWNRQVINSKVLEYFALLINELKFIKFI